MSETVQPEHGVVTGVPSVAATEPPVEDRHRAFARERGWYYCDLDQTDSIKPETLALMAGRSAREHNALPIRSDENSITVAVEDPNDLSVGNRLRSLLSGRSVRLVYADPSAIRRKIEVFYSASVEARQVAEKRTAVVKDRGAGGDLGRVESGNEGDNVTLLRLTIEQALRDDASDIHVEPVQGALLIRFRIDGRLREIDSYPTARAEGLITLIKVESEMKTDNFLVPDSGVMVYRHNGKPIDIRVETAPTAWGQSAVMRLQSNIWRPLTTLGFSESNLTRYRRAIEQPFGLILATGPTGSGKSTTLYASLNERISPEQKIITLENPIEYKAPSGISQMGMNDAQGMTFAGGLRSILRQDPDIILVGEIRDAETAETAIDAAMTGHLVFSTLHTNDAPGAIPRLTRLGLEPLLVADALLCVLGQRLLRRLCPTCKVAVEPDTTAMTEAGFDIENRLDIVPDRVYDLNPEGCRDCRNSGWAGRVPVHEVMLISEDLANAISVDAEQPEIKRLATEAGMSTMRDDAFAKMLTGMTTLAEINSSTRRALV